MRTPRRNRLASILLLAALILPAGCSNLPAPPTAPVPSAGASSGEGSSQVLGLLGSTSTTTTRTVGVLGGVVSAGNFTVVVPPGALTTTASITVSQPDPAKPVVNLSIAPASANRFLVPVVLTADAAPMNRSLLSVAYMSWYNPATGLWERVPYSSVSLLNLTVAAPLWHFSTYRVESGGKAGW